MYNYNHTNYLKLANNLCYTVKAGSFYSAIIPFHGFNTNKTLISWIKFDANTAKYLFNSNDPQGHLCSTSWNKLVNEHAFLYIFF